MSTMASFKKNELDFPRLNSAWPSCPVGMEQTTDPILFCVPTVIPCCLPFRQSLTLPCQSESCYELHDFSADNGPRFLLPALPFLLDAEFPGNEQKTVSLCMPSSARVFLFRFWEDLVLTFTLYQTVVCWESYASLLS